MNNMQDVLNNLNSDKVKDRQEGLATLREVFASDRVVNSFAVLRDGKVKPKIWLPVFQAVFTVILKEKGIVTRRTTAKSTSITAATRRLSDTANTLRWLIERAVHVLNALVADACIEHLMQMLYSGQEIFDAIALDYSKALRCIVAHQPHLDHLKKETWLQIARLSFNVILGDPLRKELVEEDEPEIDDGPSDMYVEDSEVDNEEQLSSVSKGKKRSRRDGTPLAILSPQKSQGRSRLKRNVVVSVSLEQVEFTSILRLLLSTPAAPLLPPVDEDTSPVENKLPSVVLNRLERFLQLYPADSSLLRDYIAILSAVLDHISFNKIFEVTKFARSTWSSLIGLWTTKDRAMKEGLLGVLRHLFPFITCSPISEGKLPPFDCGEGIGQLWQILDSEAESRWGVDGLSFDALRLEIKDSQGPRSTFVANTFRAGWNFDSSQALSWAVLELQADCAATLFQISESMQSTRSDSKRVRLENPIQSLLQSIQSKNSSLVRSYHLQVLLFFVDRHWNTLHEALKQDVMNVLQQFIATDDTSIQSWIFVNLAAIAREERLVNGSSPEQRSSAFHQPTWDNLWAHAVRRVNVPGICRAACHIGSALLASQDQASPKQGLITSNRILLEIETLLKDMDVQGPSFPFDSVCAFLSRCLLLASQDVRLYRMHLEDKVLSWLIDSWKVVGNRMKMPQQTISDVGRLLDTLCGLSKQTMLPNLIVLPKADIVDKLIDEQKTQVLRDFILHAKLPPFSYPPAAQSRPQDEKVPPAGSGTTLQLITPRSRDRKISAYFSRTLESLSVEWDLLKNQNPTAETARRSLDFALSAIVFESSLAFNGISANPQVIRNAGTIIDTVTPLLLGSRWILDEKLLVAQAFEQVLLGVHPTQNDFFNNILSHPGSYSGIQEKILQDLTSNNLASQQTQENHSAFLRHIWQSPDVQEIFNSVSVTMKTLLDQLLTGSTTTSENAMDVDEKDGFGPIRTTAPQVTSSDSANPELGQNFQQLLSVCIGFAACSPFLQSPSGKTAREPHLTESILKATVDPKRFCIACPIFFHFVRQKVLHLSLRTQQQFVDEFGSLLRQYALSKSQSFIYVVLDFLMSTLGVWKTEDDLGKEIHDNIKHLYAWLSLLMKRQNCGSWALRDAIARFLGNFLSEDPSQDFWASEEHFDQHQDYQDCLPSSILPRLSGDPDIRVRFRVALLNAGLFSISHLFQRNSTELYGDMKRFYLNDLDTYEYMLSRLLALGNVIIVCSEVRRGAYWHILEMCIHPSTHSYTSHIEVVLVAVSKRLGMPALSVLFEAYASQLTYSLRQLNADFFRLPAHLLGYRDRKQCAEATFRLFSPFYLISEGEKLFETHCKIIHKDVSSGFRECFGEVIGLQISSSMSTAIQQGGNLPNDFEQELQEIGSFIPNFDPPFHDTLDSTVTCILKTVADQDFSGDGPASIVQALDSFDLKLSSTFKALNRYRTFDKLHSHPPNLPAFETKNVLKCVDWLSGRWGGFTTETTYHVAHGLLDEINRTPLVNEQIRLVNALSIWIAYRQEDFDDPTIADAAIHGVTFLLSQYDLAPAAQSILEWIFARYPATKSWKESRLPNMLVRIRCIAQDYCADTLNPSVFTLGQSLVKWMDAQMAKFSRNAAFRQLITRILPTWPQQPTSALVKLYDENTVYDLSTILEDHRITSSKFRLVRRLHDLTPESRDEEQFSTTFFWRLRECIPPPEKVQDDDIRAFTSLLSLYCGQIGSFNLEQANLLSSRNRHRKNAKKHLAEDTIPARDAITLELLVMLDDDDHRRASSAYSTLRFALSVASEYNPLLVIPIEYRRDLEFLRAYKRPCASPPPIDIQECLQSEIYIKSAADFDVWLPQLTTLLSNYLSSIDPFFGQLMPILSSDVAFAEQILPVLVHTLLQTDRQAKPSTQPLRRGLSKYFSTILLSICDVRCTRAVVEVVLHLRHFTAKQDALFYNKWLDVDFSLLARGAILYGAYTTALLFVELSAEHYASTMDPKATEQVLYAIYAHIDEPDGFYGINTQDLQLFLLKRFHHEKQWDKAFKFHGASLEADSSHGEEQIGLLQSFHSFGFDRLAIESLRLFREGSSGMTASSMNYKLGWRTETWDLPEQPIETNGAALYRSLRAVYRERDQLTLKSTIRMSLHEEMEHLRVLGSENLAEIRLVSQDLLCLREISQWSQLTAPLLRQSDGEDDPDWSFLCDIDTGFDFPDLESIMATRISLVRSVRQKEERQQIGNMMMPFVRHLLDVEKKCLLRLSQAARAASEVQVALNSVIRAQKLDANPSPEVSEELANVLWLQKEEKTAVQFLQGIVKAIPRDGKDDRSVHYALLLSRLGTWTSEACLEKPTDIWESYFSRSINLLESSSSSENNVESAKATIYRECAMFAEKQYHAVLKSPDVLRWKIYVDRKTNEIEYRSKEITRTQSEPVRKQLEHDQRKARKILQEDSELFRKHNQLRETLLKQAIEMHSRCLETSGAFDDDSAIRLCSLWFANFVDESIMGAVSEALDRIPSRKLVFLAHQITARLSQPDTVNLARNQEILQNIVLRMCQEHPFHSLYQVYSISDHLAPAANRRTSDRFSQPTQTERGNAADGLLNRLRSDEVTGSRVQDVERLCDAYLQWAKFPIINKPEFKRSRGNLNIPNDLKILSIKSSQIKVPVPTAPIALDPTMKYESCIWIDHYERTFTTAGGVNLPKVSICLGSDGQKYKQLFKGEGQDDLRQDAVMEQVFDLVNNLLRRDRETKRRDLGVRGYKIIPLSNQAGLLEFVGNTAPMREWLQKAHLSYNPTDFKPDQVQSKMKECQINFKDQYDKQTEFFLDIKKRFKPVMRHYFTEKHKTPIPWFQMRLKYTRSVATTSIVGHVIGLGDRHLSNILMDTVSGEVVHIDLGIAFDQGKLLPIPERVPFRMTADIVDGMGTTGTAGVFQRCAEETLRVLRDESGVIMTVLEVFKHDPLHSWTASEIKVKQAQSDIRSTPTTETSRHNLGIDLDMTSGSADESADRALSSVARKLDKSLSIESTVNELIAEATDPTNLGTIYFAWSPYM